jgi:cholesterol oxidase
MSDTHYDWIIVGSGFGGSVSGLRLVEKGYRVLMLEKGRRLSGDDMPKSNWDLRRWLWAPSLGWRGLFKMTFFRHLTVFSGVGVGGGSLVYANTLPIPKEAFFTTGSWAGLRDWQQELQPFYKLARHMLGATPYPGETLGDRVLKEVAKDLGREDGLEACHVAVYFGRPEVTVPDPYFGGEGPARTGCHHCGGCMIGCRTGAKNTLDKNYLWLAERRGLKILPDTLVTAVRRGRAPGVAEGFRVDAEVEGKKTTFTADRVVLSGGVLGTVALLLAMRDDPDGLPMLSPRVGDGVRTNSESLIGVVTPRDVDLSNGVAITSILHTDAHSHVEPVRYPKGSGAFRLLVLPHAGGPNALVRLARAAGVALRSPLRFLRVLTVPDFARSSQILLYMRSLEGTMSLKRSKAAWHTDGMTTAIAPGAEAPTAFIPEANDIAARYAEKLGGIAESLFTETLAGIPSTAHVLGGACIGRTAEEGVINERHEVHGIPGLYVCDGSAMSANPGVNPSLSITAMSELAMSRIPAKDGAIAGPGVGAGALSA